MFLFVYVLMFVINVCFQAQLCRLIRLCLYQFRKHTTRLLVSTGFQRWVLSYIVNSREILPVQATTLLSKEIRLLLITVCQPSGAGSWGDFSGKEPSLCRKLKATLGCACITDQVLLSFSLFRLFLTFVHYLVCSFCVICNWFSVLL